MRLETAFWATLAVVVISSVFVFPPSDSQVIASQSRETTLFEAKTQAGAVTVVKEKEIALYDKAAREYAPDYMQRVIIAPMIGSEPVR
jgi:hypothetical protein